MAEFFDPAEVWQPFGTFSMGAVMGKCHLVHLKGQVALDRDGQIVGHGAMKGQLRQVLENIHAVLKHVGGQMSDVVSLTQFVTDIDAFMASGDVRHDFFREPYPETTTVEVSRLYNPDLLVEITATAEIPVDRFEQPNAIS